MEIEQHLLVRMLNDNDEFKKLYEEHADLKNKVEELNSRKFLTPEQELEKKNIQKIKLKQKDRMTQILSEYQASAL